MTNKEKYKQAFSAIHTSNNFSLEVKKMKRTNRHYIFKALVASVAACVLIVGSATAAYAANLGGIQRIMQLWIYGDQTEVTIQFAGDGSYNMEYSDKEGDFKQQGGGGITFMPDGTELPASEEDLIKHLTAPDVEYKVDGSVWVYWFDQKIDITDKFENGVCYIQLVNGKDILYMTVKYQNGFSTSPNKYLNPTAFNY